MQIISQIIYPCCPYETLNAYKIDLLYQLKKNKVGCIEIFSSA